MPRTPRWQSLQVSDNDKDCRTSYDCRHGMMDRFDHCTPSNHGSRDPLRTFGVDQLGTGATISHLGFPWEPGHGGKTRERRERAHLLARSCPRTGPAWPSPAQTVRARQAWGPHHQLHAEPMPAPRGSAMFGLGQCLLVRSIPAALSPCDQHLLTSSARLNAMRMGADSLPSCRTPSMPRRRTSTCSRSKC